jgi:peroxiredoxin
MNEIPRVGEPAPDFTLKSTTGEKVTLSSLKGRNVLIAFFPLAFTSTCTAELCDMRDEWDRFAGKGTTILPISVDSVDTLKEYKAKHDFQAEFLSDFKREVSRLYGVLIEERFYSNRAYFLVDKDGIIRWEHVEQHPGQKRTNDELFAAIDSVGA